MQIRRKNKIRVKLNKEIADVLISEAKRKNVSADDFLISLLQQIKTEKGI